MFKGTNVFEFTKLSFKTKYNNAVVYSVNGNCLFSRGKQEKKLLKRFFVYIYCELYLLRTILFLSINIPPKIDDFLRESSFTDGLLFHWRIKTGGVLIHR